MSKYFKGLNYSLANEDTWIEYKLAPQNPKSIFSVCGSGSRVTPLLAKNPQELHVVDLSNVQLMLFRLRLAAAKQLNYEDYLYLLGYTRTSSGHNTRRELMNKLKLSSEDQQHWKDQEELWKTQGFIYLGKWENHFMKLGKLYKLLSLTNLRPLFEAQHMDEQQELLRKYWKPQFFKYYTQIVMNEWVANRFLYKGHFAGSKDVKTTQLSAAEFIFHEFTDLFNNTWIRGNYFLQMIFLGEVYYSEGYPCEAKEEIFEGIKKSEANIHFHNENLLTLLKHSPHDFYSLSDTFSYINNNDVQNFLMELPRETNQKSTLVIRTFMRRPSFDITTPWKTDQNENETLAKKDCTRMYEFTILRT